MSPTILAKKILELDEQQLIYVLMQLEMENREFYNELKEKIEDVI